MKKVFFILSVIILLLLLSACTSAGESVSQDYPRLKINHDEFRAVSFIHDPVLQGRSVELYIAVSENFKILRFRASYLGSRWIFFDEAILINEQENRVRYNFSNLNRNVLAGGSVKETGDIVLSMFSLSNEKHSNINAIKDMQELLNGSNIRIRLSGRSYDEHTIHPKNVEWMRDVIAYYESITSKIE